MPRSGPALNGPARLLLTDQFDLDLDGHDHHNPKQEMTMSSGHRYLLGYTAAGPSGRRFRLCHGNIDGPLKSGRKFALGWSKSSIHT